MKSRAFLFVVFLGAIGLCAQANQLPEKKTERLADRCRKMLALQIEVFDGIKDLHKVIEGHADKKPRLRDKQTAVKLSEKQKAIIVEATATIDMLKAQGAAAAFPEVFEQMRADMKRVQSRLEMSAVGLVTQAIANDIIDTLQEMIKALEKT